MSRGLFTRAIKVDSIYLQHRGGTKDYYARRLSCGGGRHIVTFDWGKIDGARQVEVHRVSDDIAALDLVHKKIRDKRPRGYSPIQDPIREAAARESLVTLVGSSVMDALDEGCDDEIGQTNLEWLMETAGAPAGAKLSREARRAGEVEDDHPAKKRLREQEEARQRVEAKRAAAKAEEERLAREQAEQEAFYAKSDDWGLF